MIESYFISSTTKLTVGRDSIYEPSLGSKLVFTLN